MIKAVYCHLRGGYDDLYVVLRRSNAGCAAYHRRGTTRKGRTASPGDMGSRGGTLHRQRGLASGWQLLWTGLGGTRLAGHRCRPPQCLCLLGDLGCAGLLVLGAGAVVPGPLPCQGVGVLLLLSAPKELRTVPETTFPPYYSCIGRSNTF